MTEEEIITALAVNACLGLVTRHEDGSFSITAAGRAYVEEIIIPGVTDPQQIFVLGRLRGLAEVEVLKKKTE